MRIESALYTSRAGLDAHGGAISVIGDNISNSNTTGYKSSRSEFADIFANQSDAIPTAGNGAIVQKVRQLHATGTVEFTSRALDVAIAGNGFFMIGDPAAPTYSRAGNFSISSDGTLVNGEGDPVLGYQQDGTTIGTLNMSNVSAGVTATSAINVIGNLSAAEAIKVAPNAPTTFTQLKEQSSYIQNMEVYDGQGATHNVTVAYTKTAANSWVAQAYVDGSETGGTPGQPVLVGTSALNFQADGLIAEANQAGTNMQINIPYANGAAAGSMTLGLGSFTQYASLSGVTSVTQDGKGVGEVETFEFDKDGAIQAVLSNGQRVKIGNLALATFTNVDGLNRVGTTTYAAGDSVGEIIINKAGSSGLGTIEGASLERSNVDIANEFVNLVVMQRGYQANSQVLNSANGIIKDTIQLMR